MQERLYVLTGTPWSCFSKSTGQLRPALGGLTASPLLRLLNFVHSPIEIQELLSLSDFLLKFLSLLCICFPLPFPCILHRPFGSDLSIVFCNFCCRKLVPSFLSFCCAYSLDSNTGTLVIYVKYSLIYTHI